MKTGYKNKLIVAVGALTFIMMGCTKERPYDATLKDPDTFSSKALITEAGKGSIPKGEIVPDDVYLYLPSTVAVARSQSAARPHWIGEAKLVKMKFTKEDLKVVEIEKDDRFSDNELNSAPVLSIPVKHVEYQCVKDADGKCTNKEGDNDKLLWNQKGSFEIDTAKINVEEVNFFPEQLRNLYRNCFNTIKVEVKHYDLSEAGLNIQIDKTYRADITCLATLESLSELTFKVRYQYSLIKLNKLDDSKYKTLKYLAGEENTFGFFTTEDVKLSSDNNTSEAGKTVYVNRWNPGSRIQYHLNSAFDKPENASLKKATYHAVETINASFQKAGASLGIDLIEASPNDLTEGDLRKSTIVLEDDPLSTGLIGYGPSIANPMTGQLLAARTVMYTGTLKKYIKDSYDELVREKMMAKAKATGQPVAAPAADIVGLAQSGKNTGAANITFGEIMRSKVEAASHPKVGQKLSGLLKVSGNSMSKAARFSNGDISRPADIKKAAAAAQNNRLMTRATSDVKGQLEAFLQENCMYEADLFNFDAAIEADIDALITKMDGKLYLELTPAQQEEVLSTLMPFAYVPVLIHEIGHTLGLRHNFGGSEDKANFYSAEELAEMGVTRPSKYSSVMDYAYKTTNELQVMGKYDIAALRFGYAEKVETDKGEIIDLAKYRAEKTALKPYKFCTDEHVGINPNCNVFDEGTTLTEIAEHHVRSYEERYYKRNFRNGRLSFSLMTDAAYAKGVSSGLNSLRASFERYENIKKTYGIADNDPIWESSSDDPTAKFLKDLKGAVKVAATFLTDVIRTPDTSCAIVEVKNPQQIVAVVPLKQITVNAISCFDKENINLREEYAVVAQGGKSFQSVKDPASTNNYLDQIDIRGIWADKLLALDALVTRDTGITNFDEFRDNMLDVADLAGPVREALEQIVADEVVAKITLVTEAGQVLQGNIATQFFNAEEAKNGHLIVRPLDSDARDMFGINAHTPFQAKVIAMLKDNMRTNNRSQELDPSSLLNGLEVLKLKPTESTLQKGYVTIQVGTDTYAAKETASTALGAMDSFMVTSLLNSITPEKVAEILAAVKAGTAAPTTATDAEKAAYTLPAEVLEKFLGGEYQSPLYYAQTIDAMSVNKN